MKKIVGFEKIYGKRFQMMGIVWEVQQSNPHPQYTGFVLKIVDAGQWKVRITYKVISCFLDFYAKPTLEFWCDGGHLYTVELKPLHYESLDAFLGTIVGGMQILNNTNQLKDALHIKK